MNLGTLECVVNGVHGAPSCSRYSELPAVNLVRAYSKFEYVLTVINIVYFSTWLHKHKVRFTKFRNSDRNHRPNALREMFSSLRHSLGRHSLFDLTCWISSGLTTCVKDRPCFRPTVFRIKIEQNSCVIVKFNAILGYWWFMQIRQIIFNCTDMQSLHLILDKILKLLTYYTFFCHHSLQKNLISKQSGFLAHPTCSVVT